MQGQNRPISSYTENFSLSGFNLKWSCKSMYIFKLVTKKPPYSGFRSAQGVMRFMQFRPQYSPYSQLRLELW